MKDLLAKIDFFEGLDDKILNKIADACIMRPGAKNEPVVRQGETGLGLYIIARGRVKVEREQNGVRVPLVELGQEQFFGEMSLLDNKPRSATVTSLEDSEFVLLTRDGFVRLMSKYPEIPIRMARVLADRLRVANEKLATAPQPPPPLPAAETSPAQPPATNASGSAAAPPPVASATPANGTKDKIHKTLLDAFQKLYTLKAMTRFSVAVLGCPVEGVADNVYDQFRVGEVKALVFAADEPVEMRIAAEAAGSFTLHVFTPGCEVPFAFGPVAVAPDDDVRLVLEPVAQALVPRHSCLPRPGPSGRLLYATPLR
ncbi:MAG: Crp/Fnr family transcriptional regulator [Bryobacteraceae bacterium]